MARTKAEIAEYQRQWRARNRERMNEHSRAYLARHPKTGAQERQNRQSWKSNQPHNYLLYKSRSRAKQHGLEFDLTSEWLAEKLAVGRCEATGLPFSFDVGRPEAPNPWSPSVDRRDSSKGYTMENCRLVVWVYNAAKNVWTDEIVSQMARALVEKNT